MREFFKSMWRSVVESNLPGIVGAIIVLIIGWIIAVWISGKAAALAGKCAEVYRKDDEIPGGDPKRAGIITGRVVFWCVMILAVLGCMSLLHLDYAAVPLREFITAIAEYLPNIAGALLLMFLARITGGLVRNFVRHWLEKRKQPDDLDGSNQEAVEKRAAYSAQTAYVLVWLFFLPAILNALNIYGITAPLQAMFAVIMTFLPRIIAAVLSFWIGFWAAGIVRRAVSGAAVMMHVNKFCGMCGFDKEGFPHAAGLLGNVAWILIIIPVTAAALTALNIEALSHSVTGFLNMLLFAAGNIIGAVVIIATGVILARIANSIVRKLVSGLGGDRLMAKLSGGRDDMPKWDLTVICGKVAAAAVMVLVIIGACEILQLSGLAEVVRRFAIFGGNLILSAIVIIAGIMLGDFICGFSGREKDHPLNHFIRLALVVFAVALALSNLNIGQTIVETAFAMLLGAVCVAAALAFGLGGREFAANMLDKWLKKNKE